MDSAMTNVPNAAGTQRLDTVAEPEQGLHVGRPSPEVAMKYDAGGKRGAKGGKEEEEVREGEREGMM